MVVCLISGLFDERLKIKDARDKKQETRCKMQETRSKRLETRCKRLVRVGKFGTFKEFQKDSCKGTRILLYYLELTADCFSIGKNSCMR